MDGFAEYKSAAAEELPDAVPVMDPFHVVALAGSVVERCRQRIQQETLGHRGRSGDPLYGIRRILLMGANLLTRKQAGRLEEVLAAEEHTQVDVTWWIYQRIVAAYRDPRPYSRQRPTAGGHHESLYRSAGNADGADDARENPETQSC